MARHSVPRVLGRYTTGRPLNGKKAPYVKPHKAAKTPWGRLPGYQRQVVRLGLPVAWFAYSAAPVDTLAAAGAVALVSGVYAARKTRRTWRNRRFHKTYVQPTLAALTPALGDAPVQLHIDPSLGSLTLRLVRPMSPAEVAARRWYGEHVEPVVLWLPGRVQRGVWLLQRRAQPVTRHLAKLRRPVDEAGPRIQLTTRTPYLTPEQRQFISAVVGTKIPAGELVESWDQVGQQVTATWTVRKRPPARVGYADLDARMGNLAEWEFFLGLGVGGKPIVISLRDDSPHIACSAGSGAGKSVLAELVAVQILARGGQVTILDRKGSHRWALGLAGVDYCTTAEQMHNALVRLGALADQRNTDALNEDEDWDPGPRHLVVAEELNATFSQIRDYWTEIRPKGAPKTSPAVRAFRNLLFMGRSAKIGLFAVAQMLTANTTGGPESRENFGVRCLARYTKNNWQMLVPEAAMPRASRTLGRWQIVVGGVATETQVAYLTPAEARLFVAKHRGVPTDADGRLTGSHQEMSQGPNHGRDMPADPLAALVTLRDAVERGAVPWAYEAARKRLRRARAAGRAVPESAGKDGSADLYRLADLVDWAEWEAGLTEQRERVESEASS